MTTRLALVDDDQNILTSVSLMLEAEGMKLTLILTVSRP